MINLSTDVLKTPKGQIAVGLAAIALITLIVSLSIGGRAATHEPNNPYWCNTCHETYSIAELNADPAKNWRIPDEAESDMIVICIRCDKGWAYPAAECKTCGTYHLLHMDNDGRCPVCHPEVAAAAQEKGITLIPEALK